MNKSISDFIFMQEQGTPVVSETPLDSAYMEMTLALNLMEAYESNEAIFEYCTANDIAIGESFGEKIKAAGQKVAGGGKKVVEFIKALVRNIINALAADKIDKAIATMKEVIRVEPDKADKKAFTMNIPDINKLLEDVASFSDFVANGNWALGDDEDQANADNWTDTMNEILKASGSLDAMKARYDWKKTEISGNEYIEFMRKLKDSKALVKAKKILADLDKTNFKFEDEEGKNKRNKLIKQIKQMANLFVKVYDGWIKEISKKEGEWAKTATQNFDKSQKDERQEFLKDERKRESTVKESYYV